MIQANAEAEQDTELSPTQYYNVRICAQHILYAVANNLDSRNGMHQFEFTDREVGFVVGGDGADVSHPDATKEAVTVTYSTESELPDGLTLTPAGLLTGEIPAGTSTFTMKVNVLADYYLWYSYNVTVSVVSGG